MQEESETACGAPVWIAAPPAPTSPATYVAIAASSSFAFGPVVSHPERSTAATASSSADVMEGR